MTEIINKDGQDRQDEEVMSGECGIKNHAASQFMIHHFF
jgi:hypothetical protein